ncbi:MAG: hypothetical protein GPOALKHO_000541 [Sodalis sp.]|nr:MAG: hypothetical protein GPOALKHO_000541 [Sodalis sp.]
MRVMRFYPQAWPLRTPFVITYHNKMGCMVSANVSLSRYGKTEASVIGKVNSVLQGIEHGISLDILLSYCQPAP